MKNLFALCLSLVSTFVLTACSQIDPLADVASVYICGTAHTWDDGQWMTWPDNDEMEIVGRFRYEGSLFEVKKNVSLGSAGWGCVTAEFPASTKFQEIEILSLEATIGIRMLIAVNEELVMSLQSDETLVINANLYEAYPLNQEPPRSSP